LQTITFDVDIVESHDVFSVAKLQGFTDLKRPLAIQKLYKKGHGFYNTCSEACNFLILKKAKQHYGFICPLTIVDRHEVTGNYV